MYEYIAVGMVAFSLGSIVTMGILCMVLKKVKAERDKMLHDGI